MQLYNALYLDASGNVTLRTGNGSSISSSIADSLIIDATDNYWFAVVSIGPGTSSTISYIDLATGVIGTPIAPITPVATDNTVQTIETQYDAILPSIGIQNWSSIASSSDGTKLAAAVNGGAIYTSVNSGAVWVSQITGSGSRAWSSIVSSSDGTKLAAAVNGGYIYVSMDSGATWSQKGTYANWSSMASSSDCSKLVAVVNNGGIYTSTDAGSTWVQRTNAPTAAWTSVASSANGNKLVATNGTGNIYVSTDSGSTWISSSIPNNATSSTISSDGAKLAVVINNGRIYTSTDSGASWSERIGAPIKAWSSIASSSDGVKLVATVNGGNIYTSADSGLSWVEQLSSGVASWSSVASSANGTNLVAVINSGYVYRSTDSGNSWVARTGTYYEAGDPVLSVVLLDSHNKPPTVLSSCWINLRSQQVIPAPVLTDIIKSDNNVKALVTSYNPTSVVSFQMITTTSTVKAPFNALVNGIIITASDTNAGDVWVGNSALSTSNGYKLTPGQSISYGVANTDAIYIIGTNSTDTLYFTGN